MTGLNLPIHVLAAAHFDPGCGRLAFDLPEGMTVAEIVAATLPDLTVAERALCRVTLVTDLGMQTVPKDLWALARPRPGVRVVVRVIAGKNALRSILSIVVSIAAIATGQLWGLKFGTMLGFSGATATAVGSALLGMGVTIVGNLLINALVPPPKPENRAAQNRYQISGWHNRLEPGGAVPDVLGQMRFAPPFAALSHTEILGDWQYVRALFCLGYGPLEVTDMRIGETSLSEYAGVDIELRYGLPGDTPVALFPRQIAEESIGVELTRPKPRDELGEVIAGGATTDNPVVRTTGADASRASVILAFPAGLVRFDSKGKSQAETVSIRIEQRLVQAEDWLVVTTLTITAKKLEAFFRQHSWDFPSRGRWQVRLTMMTDEATDSQVQRRTSWAALQTIRPEYPLNFSKPLALVALRVKATHQLSGALDSFNCLVRRVCLDWDHLTQTWVERATSNPASLFRSVLQGPANPRPVADAGIDLDLLADWHDFCRTKGLNYDRVIEASGMTLRDVLTEIAGAGRASPRHDGLRWGVVIDRPDQLVVDHISPRNSWGVSVARTYVQPPHGFRVAFIDATNDYKPVERLVPWPGHSGPVELTEALELPGKTDPDEVYREALRRMYEAIYRPDRWQVTQDGPARVSTRGDLVRLSSDLLSRVQMAARVMSVTGNLLEIDAAAEMADGLSYAVRFRVFADLDDTIGTSVVRLVKPQAGWHTTLMLSGTGAVPVPGDLIQFGLAASETAPLIVSAVEAADGFASILHLVDAAPEIDAAVDAAVIPAWSGRVGAEIATNMAQPSQPRFVAVVAGSVSDATRIDYLLTPGVGAVSTANFRVAHRHVGATDWTSLVIPVANGGGSISAGYATGDAVELRAQGISHAGVDGPWTATLTVTMGAGDAGIPAALDADTVIATPRLGGVLIQFATGADADTAAVQIYRSTTATLNRETDAAGAPLAVEPLSGYGRDLGDAGRTNMLAGSWTLGTDWSITSGVASHLAGTASDLSQAQSITSGKWYRFGMTVTAVTAGDVRIGLTGGTDRMGAARTAPGTYLDRVQAVTGNAAIAIRADSAFAGSVTDVAAYQETAACLAQGIHYLWLEPQNADGVPGPVTGPITVSII